MSKKRINHLDPTDQYHQTSVSFTIRNLTTGSNTNSETLSKTKTVFRDAVSHSSQLADESFKSIESSGSDPTSMKSFDTEEDTTSSESTRTFSYELRSDHGEILMSLQSSTVYGG